MIYIVYLSTTDDIDIVEPENESLLMKIVRRCFCVILQWSDKNTPWQKIINHYFEMI